MSYEWTFSLYLFEEVTRDGLRVVLRSLLVTRHSSRVTFHSTRHSSLVTRHFSLYSSLVTLFDNFLIRPIVNIRISPTRVNRGSMSVMYPRSRESSIWVSTSARDPSAIWRNLENSTAPPRAAPSAMFDGTETAARRNWFVRPNRSSLGNALVAA